MNGSFDSLIAAYERHEAREIKRSGKMTSRVRKLYLGEPNEVLTYRNAKYSSTQEFAFVTRATVQRKLGSTA